MILNRIVRAVVFFIPAFFGCSTVSYQANPSRSPSSDSGGVCEVQHAGKTSDGEAVVICDRTFPTLPFVRPPSDELNDPNAVVLHAGLKILGDPMNGISSFVDRKGIEYAWIDANGKPVAADVESSELPETMHLPSHRNLYLTYLVTGKISKRDTSDGSSIPMNIQVIAVKPEILITGCAMDSAFLGNWEGTATAHAARAFGPIIFSDPVPLQMTLDRISPMRDPLATWEGGSDLPHLPDGKINTIYGRFTNLHAETKSFLNPAKILPPMDAVSKNQKSNKKTKILTDNGPFAGINLEDAITMNRMASMHTPRDEVVILYYPETANHTPPSDLPGSGMDGDQQVWTPYSLIQDENRPQFRTLSITPHGPPSGHHIIMQWTGPGTIKNSCTSASD